jgi:Cytidylate kinase-like family
MNRKRSSELVAEAMERVHRHFQKGLQAEVAAEPPLAPAVPAFTVAISREAGAHGPQVARAVGERLGWPVYDREILQVIAAAMGLPATLLESMDERRKGWLRLCLESFTATPPVTEGAYARHLVETLLALAAHGGCIIVGRGAAQVLPVETTLRVRLAAPAGERVEAIRQRFGIPFDEASRWVERTDQERVAFVKNHFRKDPADPRGYDLVLNSARFSVAQCARLVIEALQQLRSRAPARAPEPALA